MTNLLKVRNICKSIDNKQILSDVSLNIDKGEIVGLLGPNGAGKTTTFYSIAGITHINSGSIIYNDEEICDLPMYARCQRGLAYLPQESSIFEDLIYFCICFEYRSLSIWALTPQTAGPLDKFNTL